VKVDDSAWDDTMSEAPPDALLTFMRIARSRGGMSGGGHAVTPATAKPRALDPFPSETFQFSALFEFSVVAAA
jgi:hypothetical protein